MRKGFFVLLLMCGVAHADFQTWAGLYLRSPLSGRWQGFFELQNRIYSGEQRLLIRPAVGYRISQHHTLWLGYGWTPIINPTFVDEHRLWQQSLAEYRWSQWELSFRFRLEERFVGGATGWRWREMIRAGYYPKPSWALIAWDEFFFNFNSYGTVTDRGFEQNRLFLGAKFHVQETWWIEAGYLNQLVRQGAGSRANHAVVIYVNWKAAEPAETTDTR